QFKIGMNRRDIAQVCTMPDVHPYGTLPDSLKDLVSQMPQFARFLDECGQGGFGQKNGSFLRQDADVERRYGTAGLPVADHDPQWAQAVQRSEEGVLAYRVIRDIDAPARCQRFHLRGEIALVVQDDMIAAGSRCDRHFVVGSDCADDNCPKMLGPLAQHLPHSARGGVYKQGIAWPYRVDAMQ